MRSGCIVVLDIGKTFAKLTLLSPDGQQRAKRTRANASAPAAATYPTLDVAGIEAWLAESLTAFVAQSDICCIIPVAHGAAACVLTAEGWLAPMDYEAVLPANLADQYRALRDPFAQTGSPALPGGLNLGAQLYWLETLFPSAMARGTIVPWPQFWAWRLCGVAATEVTSLGCHTDLWCPTEHRPSDLAEKRGWAARFAPSRAAGDVLGYVTQEWRDRCGLPDDCAVLCGLHDSNAAFLAVRGYPAIAGKEHSVLSTGTWFVAMRATPQLDMGTIAEDRDCLVNVDAYGMAVPSARFMGGRETELLVESLDGQIDASDMRESLQVAAIAAIRDGVFALPSFQADVGPFARQTGRWIKRPREAFARRAVASLYLALVSDVVLTLIGSRERLVIEGRFAGDPVFTTALAELRPDLAIYRAPASNSLCHGALRLIRPDFLPPDGGLARVQPGAFGMRDYAAAWRQRSAS